MFKDSTNKFALVIAIGITGRPYTTYDSQNVPQEMVIEQLKALLNRMEKEYNDNFSPTALS